MGHESVELGAVFGGDVVEAAVDGTAEFGEVVVAATVEHVAFDELPEAFDQIQVRGIRRQGEQLDVERRREALHHRAVVIACVVENQSDWPRQPQRGDLTQQVTHGVRRHRPGCCDPNQFVRHGVPCSQHAVALAAGNASNHQATHAPLTAQERSLYEVGGVHKKHMTLATVCCFELRFQLLFEKLGLDGHMLLDGFLGRQRDGRRATPLQTETFLRKCRT